MNEIVEKLYKLLETTLIYKAPKLSGNLKKHIEVVEVKPHEVVLKIAAPFYDLNTWNKEKRIVYTGSKNGLEGYAKNLNEHGAFNSNNTSKGWTNRVVIDICEAIASEYQAIVNNQLK